MPMANAIAKQPRSSVARVSRGRARQKRLPSGKSTIGEQKANVRRRGRQRDRRDTTACVIYVCAMPNMHPLLAELTWRGLLYQQTEPLNAALGAGVVTGYCGFDPTAASLHLGHLVPVMGLMHLQRAGHRPIVLIGGGTGMIGDPSGRTSERRLHTPEIVAANSRAIRAQLEHFLDFSGDSGAIMRDNAEWLMPMGAVEFMRDVGKHFTVSYMMQKESVRTRMEEAAVVHRVQLHVAAGEGFSGAAPARRGARCKSAAAISGATSRRGSSCCGAWRAWKRTRSRCRS